MLEMEDVVSEVERRNHQNSSQKLGAFEDH